MDQTMVTTTIWGIEMADKYRVMALDECGTEVCLANDLSHKKAWDFAGQAREDYPEYRCFDVELQVDYHAMYANMDEDELYMHDQRDW